MSVTITREELAQVVGGVIEPRVKRLTCTGVEFDSRAVHGGELFVALAGEASHGHNFVARAFERGAALAMVESADLVKQVSEPSRLIVVPDSLSAFWQLGAWWRQRLGMPVAAVTGSVGKTTVKDLIAQILLQRGRGGYSLKSYNNQTGVPYTLCSLHPDYGWAVVEIGMNHPGEIANLAPLVAPEVGVITRVAAVHQHAFKSIDEIADAKFELAAAIAPGGTLVVNGDDPVSLRACERHGVYERLKVLRFGTGIDSNVRLCKVDDRGLDGIDIALDVQGESLAVHLKLIGTHNAFNAAAAVLTARALLPDLTLNELQRGLQRCIGPRLRMERRMTARGRVIVDDSYNANPMSMKALFEVAKCQQKLGKSIGLILGDMLELGDESRRFHDEVALAAAELRPLVIVAVGAYADRFVAAGRALGVPSFAAPSPEVAAHTALKYPADILFIKASRGIKLDRAATKILEVEGEQIPGIAEQDGKVVGMVGDNEDSVLENLKGD